MCKDCGCSITGHSHEEVHSHAHDAEHSHDHHHGGSHAHQEAHQHLHDNPQLNDPKTISVITKILDKNDQEAQHNREHFNKHDVLCINLMSSPGSGKTTLLEHLSKVADFKFGVVEGDLETSRDADRLSACGIQAHQIQTGSACHLDAFMVHKALHHMDLESVDVCFIENVGNLVCPASYDVGSHLNIVLVSVPEGEDKIAKYPVMFRTADLILFTKTDLLPYFEYDMEKEKEMARKLKPSVDILEVSTKDAESLKKVASWIKFKMEMR
ncbi:MAG: hydrogenase nickel incorporation protein HypB [Epsilonproteobacteria bacterium]|nr:hydrogenase nickel incorporation protein HypB [Campylobacterota bacterium]OIO17543.1 MAG: hydrogenase accessory protein HypB [Helicobacteraceae bacterium CG1_02_36_14]PIP10664.1 MAG: hydrogenase accessory protein HypB [Sulfurimonas sp. CG23_combo_of_CG06-09_8_20_14_all_36_33]PIS25637.1 MAG: hydrogenase accessory protein HypB [Sulfurimonas sp. CG08_land_8_20_14_0_20_36_33]PIU34944.1 MAG: hydrogenase accessory protein HypB [Sulfurimonas sp. CG07_land_8_20_14_0_80_36_56]PIV04657.1 MAG: hydroge